MKYCGFAIFEFVNHQIKLSCSLCQAEFLYGPIHKIYRNIHTRVYMYISVCDAIKHSTFRLRIAFWLKLQLDDFISLSKGFGCFV